MQGRLKGSEMLNNDLHTAAEDPPIEMEELTFILDLSFHKTYQEEEAKRKKMEDEIKAKNALLMLGESGKIMAPLNHTMITKHMFESNFEMRKQLIDAVKDNVGVSTSASNSNNSQIQSSIYNALNPKYNDENLPTMEEKLGKIFKPSALMSEELVATFRAMRDKCVNDKQMSGSQMKGVYLGTFYEITNDVVSKQLVNFKYSEDYESQSLFFKGLKAEYISSSCSSNSLRVNGILEIWRDFCLKMSSEVKTNIDFKYNIIEIGNCLLSRNITNAFIKSILVMKFGLKSSSLYEMSCKSCDCPAIDSLDFLLTPDNCKHLTFNSILCYIDQKCPTHLDEQIVSLNANKKKHDDEFANFNLEASPNKISVILKNKDDSAPLKLLIAKRPDCENKNIISKNFDLKDVDLKEFSPVSPTPNIRIPKMASDPPQHDIQHFEEWMHFLARNMYDSMNILIQIDRVGGFKKIPSVTFESLFKHLNEPEKKRGRWSIDYGVIGILSAILNINQLELIKLKCLSCKNPLHYETTETRNKDRYVMSVSKFRFVARCQKCFHCCIASQHVRMKLDKIAQNINDIFKEDIFSCDEELSIFRLKIFLKHKKNMLMHPKSKVVKFLRGQENISYWKKAFGPYNLQNLLMECKSKKLLSWDSVEIPKCLICGNDLIIRANHYFMERKKIHAKFLESFELELCTTHYSLIQMWHKDRYKFGNINSLDVLSYMRYKKKFSQTQNRALLEEQMMKSQTTKSIMQREKET